MDFESPVSKFMTTKLIAVSPKDSMSVVKDIFDKNKLHHIPVVKYTTLVGIISKADYLHFLRGKNINACDHLVESTRLETYKAEDVMTKGIATLESTDRINVALQVFSENLFHAIPIVDNGVLVGMLTTLDIIKGLMEEDRIRILSN
jgi:acetoin utilization protein AcuB